MELGMDVIEKNHKKISMTSIFVIRNWYIWERVGHIFKEMYQLFSKCIEGRVKYSHTDWQVT